MANEKNLIQYSGRSREEAEELSRKGGINSGKARRRKRDMRESMRTILDTPLNENQMKQIQQLGLPAEDWKLTDLVNIMAVQTALKGNVRSMEFVRDTAGYNPDLQLKEEQFEYERERKSGQGAEIEDISPVVTEIWGYDKWMNIMHDGVPVILTRRIPYQFAACHIEYIEKCRSNTYNILEGAVRSGKTVDHILAFAIELCDAPDKFHLATGSTMANAKLNIGDSNGFGLEHIFRGQCRWTRYKDNDALIIRGPYTNFEEKVVIFAGGGSSVSHQKIRGNSYGLWIATEINLHHDNMIKEAFNRQLAAKRRKIFWDLNPEHPKAPIYQEYIDKYAERAATGELIGGFNYAHFTIFDNATISKDRLKEIISQYDPGSIWYIRDIEGKRSIAEGLIYHKMATSISADDNYFLKSKKAVKAMLQKKEILKINVGIDFGGNGSGHAFVATAVTQGYRDMIVLRTERYLGDDIDPTRLGELFVAFLRRVISDYGFVTKIYADSAEQVLIRGIRNVLNENKMGDIKVHNALKGKITDRIFLTTAMAAQGRLWWTEDTQTYQEAVSMAVWDSSKLDLIRLDDGSSDIDTLDAFEYTIERDYKKYLNSEPEGGGKK